MSPVALLTLLILAGAVLLASWALAIVSVARVATGLRRVLWLLGVVVFPVVGPLVWFVSLGSGERRRSLIGS